MIRKNGHNKRKITKLNNSGSALVVVIIAMAFIGILASVLMYTSLLNYQMKANNLKAKDNFYSAESVLDEIRLGMQGEVSTSIGKAYQNILTNFDENNAQDKQFRMKYAYLSQIQSDFRADALVSGVSKPDTYDLEKLYGYLVSTRQGTILSAEYNDNVNTYLYSIELAADAEDVAAGKDLTKDITIDGTVVSIVEKTRKKNASGGWDVVDTSSSDKIKGNMVLYENALVFKNITVKYTDDNGYVSQIKTDLRVTVPAMQFAESVTLPSITSYSIVAQEKIKVVPGITTGSTSENTISGSFYCEGLEVGAVSTDTNLLPGTVTLHLAESSAANNDKRMVVSDELSVGKNSKLDTDNYGELWAGSITMHGSSDASQPSTIDFNGNSVYVADDTIIYGSNNYFKAGDSGDGQYIGFGSEASAESSSAIIVNGTNTEIDVSELSNLTLAGNAYIGIGGGKDATGAVSSDVVMGQSIAVKSDQIAYLVPAACIGITKNDDGSQGSQKIPGITNPMPQDTWSELSKYVADGTVYEVGDEIACDVLDGNTLKELGIVTTDSNKKAMIQTYFKQVNSSLTLVYYYVCFDSNDKTSMQNANKYFETYYNKNKTTLDAYTQLYTTGIKLKSDEDGFYTLHLAGNVVRYNSTDGASLKNSTVESDNKNAGYSGLLTISQSKFKALCKKLIDSYDLLQENETVQSANAYSNMVRESQIDNYYYDINHDPTAIYSESQYLGTGTGKAAIINGDFTYPSGTTFNGLIIATGNVTIEAGKTFHGTILCGGNVTLKEGASVETDSAAVLEALSASNTVNGNKYNVTDFLYGGSGYLNSSGKTYSESTIDLGDLVVYENWEKQ